MNASSAVPLVALLMLVQSGTTLAQSTGFTLPAAAWSRHAGANGLESDGFFMAPALSLSGARSAPAEYGFRMGQEPSGGFIGYRAGNWVLGSAVGAMDEVGVDPNNRMDVTASYGWSLSPRQRLSFEGGLAWSLPAYEHTHMLDITGAPVESRADSGVGLRLSWLYSFDRNRYISTSLGYAHALHENEEAGTPMDRGASFGTYFGYRY